MNLLRSLTAKLHEAMNFARMQADCGELPRYVPQDTTSAVQQQQEQIMEQMVDELVAEDAPEK